MVDYTNQYLNSLRHNKDSPLYLPKGFEFKGPPPFRHQVVSFIHSLAKQNLAILHTMGLGKTRIAIDTSRYWLKNNYAKNVLVISPTTVLHSWKKQIGIFSEHDCTILHATQREDRIDLFKNDTTFFAINYEAVSRYMKYLLRKQFDVIIFDESSKIANPSAIQTKACFELAAAARFRYILNGTPVANRPMDLWSQFYAVDFGESLGQSFNAFRNAHFTKRVIKTPVGFVATYKIRNWACLEKIANAIVNRSIRYTKEECDLDLPEKTYQVRKITLPQANRELYEKVLEYAKLEIRNLGQNVSALMKVTKLEKVQQITSGFLKTDDGDFIVVKDNPKLEEVRRLVTEIVPENAVVIWCKHIHAMDMIEKMLRAEGINYLDIRGETKNKGEVAEKFQQTSIEEYPVLVGQVNSGGIGIDLYKASYTIFYENDLRLLSRLQAEGRTHRVGQHKPCIYIDIVTEDSVEELTLAAIEEKAEVAEFILSKLEG